MRAPFPSAGPGAPVETSDLAVSPQVRETSFAVRLRSAARRVLLFIVGSNPWPSTGAAGHVAVVAMLCAALAFLWAGVRRELFGPPLERYFGNDFIAYLTAAALIVQGQASRLYDPEAQLAMQRALLATVGAEASGIEYVNPPLWAAMVAFLYPLGVAGGDFVWRVLTLAIGAWVLLRVAKSEGVAYSWRAIIVLLAMFPFVQAWHHRSMVAVLMLSFAGWMVFSRAGRPRTAGLVLSLLFLKPQYLPFLMVYLAWKRQWQQIVGLAMGGAIQALLTVGLFAFSGGLPTLETLAQFVAFDAAGTGSAIEAHVTLRSLVLRLFPDASASARLITLAVATAATFAGVLLAFGSRWRTREGTFFWEALAVAAVANATAYHGHMTGLVLLLPPAAVLLLGSQATQPPGSARRVLAALSLGLAAPSIGILLISQGEWLYVLGGWVTVIVAVVLGVLAVRQLPRLSVQYGSGISHRGA